MFHRHLQDILLNQFQTNQPYFRGLQILKTRHLSQLPSQVSQCIMRLIGRRMQSGLLEASLLRSAQVSLKPADIIIAAFISFLAQSSSAAGINFGGITIIARSIVPSIFSRDGNVLSPRSSEALGFTGNIWPGNPRLLPPIEPFEGRPARTSLLLIRFDRMLWPVFPSSLVWPMTATDLGLKKE